MIRSYRDADYDQIKELYGHKELYGGVFDKARDSREILASKIKQDPEAILVCDRDGEIVGTLSLIDDGRVAWLYRFIVKGFDPKITKQLYDKASATLKSRGHTQVLVYSDPNSLELQHRYSELGMNRGDNYECYWREL
jgi:hypothetical protein